MVDLTPLKLKEINYIHADAYPVTWNTLCITADDILTRLPIFGWPPTMCSDTVRSIIPTEVQVATFLLAQGSKSRRRERSTLAIPHLEPT